MSALHSPFRSRIARGLNVAALLFAVTLGGTPLGASCCGLGGKCDCGVEKTAESVTPTAPVSDNACPCCSSHKGRCQRCCLRRKARTSTAKSSRHLVSVAALPPSESAPGNGCTELPVRGKRGSSQRCHCAHRADFDAPRHVSPLRAPITERVVENQCDRFQIDQLATGQFSRYRNLAPVRSDHAARVITQCCLVI
jgi:hypothetical protein